MVFAVKMAETHHGKHARQPSHEEACVKIHWSIVVGGQPFVIAGSPLNIHVVVYIHRVHT